MPRRGFTLIELLLSIATLSLLVFVMASLIASMVNTKTRLETSLRVQREGERVLSIIEQSVRDSRGIVKPLAGQNEQGLSLQSDDPAADPTVFSINGSQLAVTEGADSPSMLTSSRIIASNFTVANNGRVGTNGIVRFQFTLSSANPSGRAEYDYAHTFAGSVNLRR